MHNKNNRRSFMSVGGYFIFLFSLISYSELGLACISCFAPGEPSIQVGQSVQLREEDNSPFGIVTRIDPRSHRAVVHWEILADQLTEQPNNQIDPSSQLLNDQTYDLSSLKIFCSNPRRINPNEIVLAWTGQDDRFVRFPSGLIGPARRVTSYGAAEVKTKRYSMDHLYKRVEGARKFLPNGPVYFEILSPSFYPQHMTRWPAFKFSGKIIQVFENGIAEVSIEKKLGMIQQLDGNVRTSRFPFNRQSLDSYPLILSLSHDEEQRAFDHLSGFENGNLLSILISTKWLRAPVESYGDLQKNDTVFWKFRDSNFQKQYTFGKITACYEDGNIEIDGQTAVPAHLLSKLTQRVKSYSSGDLVAGEDKDGNTVEGRIFQLFENGKAQISWLAKDNTPLALPVLSWWDVKKPRCRVTAPLGLKPIRIKKISR